MDLQQDFGILIFAMVFLAVAACSLFLGFVQTGAFERAADDLSLSMSSSGVTSDLSIYSETNSTYLGASLGWRAGAPEGSN